MSPLAGPWAQRDRFLPASRGAVLWLLRGDRYCCLARSCPVRLQVEFESSNGLDYRLITSFDAVLKPGVGRIANRAGAEIWDRWDSFQLRLVIFLCAPRLYPVRDSITYFIQIWKIALMWLVLCFWGLFSANVLSNWICFHIVISRAAFYLLWLSAPSTALPHKGLCLCTHMLETAALCALALGGKA